jgi:hypothetical protein
LFSFHKSHRLIGTGRASLANLLAHRSAQPLVTIPLEKTTLTAGGGGGTNTTMGSAGELRFLQLDVQTDYSFLDYIASGYK